MATRFSARQSLGNPRDRGAWWATVHGVARVRHDLVTKPPPPGLIKLKGVGAAIRGQFSDLIIYLPLIYQASMY